MVIQPAERVVEVELGDRVEVEVGVLPWVSVVVLGWSDLPRCLVGLAETKLVVFVAPSLLPCPPSSASLPLACYCPPAAAVASLLETRVVLSTLLPILGC